MPVSSISVKGLLDTHLNMIQGKTVLKSDIGFRDVAQLVEYFYNVHKAWVQSLPAHKTGEMSELW